MAADGVHVRGLDEAVRKLKEVPKALRRRHLRNWLAAGGRLVRNEARRLAPVLSLRHAVRAPHRKPGTVRDAISVRTSKNSRRSGDVGVFVNVRPAKPGQRGAKSRNDPFYWRWLEFGHRIVPRRSKNNQGNLRKRRRAATRVVAPIRFLGRAAGKLGAALGVFEAQLGKWLVKTNASGKVEG